jgi:adenylylsulfate kinase-like enzyme
MRRPATVFITGISASGKSTLGKKLKEGLLKNNIDKVKLLDGEDIREQLERQGKRYGYTTEERNKVALEIAHIALEYNRKGIICIICSICHLKLIRQQMRTIIGNYMEVYLDCPVEICAQRDYKGNYSKAFEGKLKNFIGVNEPYQKSDNVDLILYTGRDPAEKCSQRLLASVISFLNGKSVQGCQVSDDVKDPIGADR